MAITPKWTHIEQPFDNGEWHGVIDRIGHIRGQDALCVADIKTGTGSGALAQRRIATQLAAYAMGWEPGQYEQVLRVGIYLKKDGGWKTVVYSNRRDFDYWQHLLREAKYGTQAPPEAPRDADRRVERDGPDAHDHRPADVPSGVSRSPSSSKCGRRSRRTTSRSRIHSTQRGKRS